MDKMSKETSNTVQECRNKGNELVIGIIYRIFIRLNFPLNH